MSRENICDSSGNVLYSIEDQGNKLIVIKADGTVLGWCENGNTYDATGKLICYGKSPGALYKG